MACLGKITRGVHPANVLALQLPEDFCKMVEQCWNQDPSSRPTIKQTITVIERTLPRQEPSSSPINTLKPVLQQSPNQPLESSAIVCARNDTKVAAEGIAEIGTRRPSLGPSGGHDPSQGGLSSQQQDRGAVASRSPSPTPLGNSPGRAERVAPDDLRNALELAPAKHQLRFVDLTNWGQYSIESFQGHQTTRRFG